MSHNIVCIVTCLNMIQSSKTKDKQKKKKKKEDGNEVDTLKQQLDTNQTELDSKTKEVSICDLFLLTVCFHAPSCLLSVWLLFLSPEPSRAGQRGLETRMIWLDYLPDSHPTLHQIIKQYNSRGCICMLACSGKTQQHEESLWCFVSDWVLNVALRANMSEHLFPDVKSLLLS